MENREILQALPTYNPRNLEKVMNNVGGQRPGLHLGCDWGGGQKPVLSEEGGGGNSINVFVLTAGNFCI